MAGVIRSTQGATRAGPCVLRIRLAGPNGPGRHPGRPGCAKSAFEEVTDPGWSRPNSLGTLPTVPESMRRTSPHNFTCLVWTIFVALFVVVSPRPAAAVETALGISRAAPASSPSPPPQSPRKKTPAPAGKKAPDDAAAANEPGSPPAAGAKKPAAGAGGEPAGGSIRTNVRESEIYGDRLDALDKEIEALKDKVFRSKARLALLKETVLRGVMAGSRVILAHRNRMGASFRLVKIVYVLDGAQIFARSDDSGSLDEEDEITVFDGNLPPGAHTATVELVYRGHGFGLFAYLNAYTFESRSTYTFTAPENAAVKVTSVGYERGNMTTEMKDRPAVDWQIVPLDALGRPIPTAARKARPAKATSGKTSKGR